jgi:hypothetical protein
MAELAGAANGTRNETLNAIAYRLGRMVARGWVARTDVEAALIGAMHANGYVSDDGIAAVEATLRSGLDAGVAEPHPDIPEQEEPAAQPKPESAPEPPPRYTLEEVHIVFRKWFGAGYELDVIDAVLAAAAAERLSGDPLWLLVVSGPGNTKTETVQSTSGAGAYVTSTIASEGALLSAYPKKAHAKNATGGLLRRIGDRGTLVIKDFTSILSGERTTRGGVLAALRKIYDGRWERNVGTDGGMSLCWTGRIVVIAAVTTAWDAAHVVVSAMGDRFVLIRSDSTTGRIEAGTQAINNTGNEVPMRAELAKAVGGLIGHINEVGHQLDPAQIKQLVAAANIVTYARTAVERDCRGDVVDAHAPEAPTRFAKQLAQMVRGGVAIGMTEPAAMRLALRCARDSIPQLRLAVLLDLVDSPNSRATEVCKRVVRPYRTVRRELEALHTLGLLTCTEEQSVTDETKTVWRYSLNHDRLDRDVLLSIGGCPGASHG